MSNLKITVEGTVSHIEINVVVKNTINKKESLKTLHLTNLTLDQWNELIAAKEKK
jgi:predicted AAA+ superfamily ATPase